MRGEMNFQTVPLIDVPTEGFLEMTGEYRPLALVVDDERLIADTVTLILRRSGFAVMTAYDGLSALETARVIPPELLISDIAMPRLNGIDMAIAINQISPDCEIILLSGQASTVDYLGSLQSRGHDFLLLSKPIHPLAMLSHISQDLRLRGAEQNAHARLIEYGVATSFVPEQTEAAGRIECLAS